MGDMRKASRLFEIIQILRLARHPITAAEIALRLEVTVRSIYRDIAALQAMRVPVEGERKPGDLVPVQLESLVTELGTLELWCVARDGKGRWKLEYSVPNASKLGARCPARSTRSPTSSCRT